MSDVLSPTAFFLIATEVAAVAWLLTVVRRNHHRLQWIAKPAASGIFVVLALTRAEFTSTFDVLMVAGLLLGLAGDILLIDNRTFRLGLLTFLGGHIAYILAFDHAQPCSDWSLVVLLPLIVIAAGAAGWLWPYTKEMRGATSAYIVVISLMAWGGVSLSISGTLPITVGIGAALFFLSDLAVARHKFVRASFVNRVVGLPTYYAAQVLMALSVGSS